MDIQNITYFIPLTWPIQEDRIANAVRFLKDARNRFAEAGMKVQALNLALPPFLDVLGHPAPDLLLEYGYALDALAIRYGIDGVSIGPVQATTPLALLMPIHTLPQLIATTEKITSSVLFVDKYSGINLAAVHDTAQAIQQLSRITPNGQGNLRLGLLANVPAHVPFLPAAYQHGFKASFSLAVNVIDLALTAVTYGRSINKAREQLTEAIEAVSQEMGKVINHLVDDHHLQFNGIDYSAVPKTGQAGGIGAMVEKLGADAFGGNGTLFGLSFLASAMQQANIGLAGIRLPLLGDAVIAARVAAGDLGVSDLLLYSAICGGGLDLVPIPGNTTAAEIAAILLDIAALANSTGKPISARLMPVPGLAAGDKVAASAGLAEGVVLPLKGLGVKGLLQQSSFFSLPPVRSKVKKG